MRNLALEAPRLEMRYFMKGSIKKLYLRYRVRTLLGKSTHAYRFGKPAHLHLQQCTHVFYVPQTGVAVRVLVVCTPSFTTRV